MLNDFLHSVVQLCGFSPLSMNMCFFNFPVCVNDFLHCAQVWGFSPVWMTIWVLWFRAWLNYFLHSVHLCGFSPLRVSMCRIMWLQISCICLYSLQCVFCCDISWATVPVEKLHWVHLWALGIEKEKTGSGWTFLGQKLDLYIALGTALEKKRQRSSVRGCRRTCSMKLCSCLT